MNRLATRAVRVLAQWRGAAAGVMLVLPLMQAAPAHATTAIYYSAPENAYGWCAGFSSNRSHRCAEDYCTENGGTACEAVLECPDGWGAVALAAPPAKGIGASCGKAIPFGARALALATCMAASNALCWTDTTFNGNGDAAGRDADRAFDLTFLVQGMLQINGQSIGSADGEFGPATRAAIEAFEAELDRVPTGILSDELFQTLLVTVGGDQNLARKIKEGALDKTDEAHQRRTYAFSPSPAGPLSYSERLLGFSPEERRMALAILVAANGSSKCTAPALSADLVGEASGGMWLVGCSEGGYTLIMPDGGPRILIPMGGGQ
ncbi:MAG: peptidoglycan-binding domain-containing protein [Propylenella sp.]